MELYIIAYLELLQPMGNSVLINLFSLLFPVNRSVLISLGPALWSASRRYVTTPNSQRQHTATKLRISNTRWYRD